MENKNFAFNPEGLFFRLRVNHQVCAMRLDRGIEPHTGIMRVIAVSTHTHTDMYLCSNI